MRRKGRKNSKSLLKKRMVILVVGILSLFGVLSLVVHYLIDEEFVVQRLEESFTLKAEVGEVDISLFSPSQRLVLRNVRLTGKVGDLRAEGAEVRVEKVALSVSLMNLLRKRIEVSEVTLHGAHIMGKYYEDGETSIEALFESKNKSRQPKIKKKSKGSGLNAFENHDFVAALGGFYMRDSSVNFIIEKSNLEIECKNLNMALAALEIDPNDLAGTDQAKLELSAELFLRSTKGWEYGQLDLSGSAETRLFNPETGELEPDVRGDFQLGDTSRINTNLPVINKMWEKLDLLKKVGISVAPLPEKVTFGRSESLAAHYHLGKVTVLKPLSVWIGEWELAILKDSWIQTETDQHEMFAELGASKKASKFFSRLVKDSLKIFPKKMRPNMAKRLYGRLFKEERLLLRVRSSENFTRPKVRLVDGVPDISKSAEEAGKKILEEKAEGLLRGLLKKI